MRVEQVDDNVLDDLLSLVLHNNDYTWKQPLLEDPHVSVLFKQDAIQSCLQEFRPDHWLLIEEVLDALDQVLILRSLSLFKVLKDEFVE